MIGGAGGQAVGVVVRVARCWSFCRDFGDGGAGGAFVDDALVARERSDEGLDGEVVHRAGQPAADLVDERDGVVAQ